jgi:hypothetical protein
MAQHKLSELPAWIEDRISSENEVQDDAQDAIEAHNARIKKHTKDTKPMDYSKEELDQAIVDLGDEVALKRKVQALPGTVEAMGKSVATQRHEMAQLRSENATLRRANDELEARLAAVERRQSQTSHAVGTLRKGLREEWHERHEAPREEPSALVKAVASFLPTDATREQAERTAVWVVKSFGRNGGQTVRYDRECAAKLVLAKAITPDELQRWRDHDRLPDHVDVAHPQPHAAVLQQQASSLVAQHALAGLGVSALVFPSLARRGR